MPQDILAMQELIWEVQPDLIIECGVAHGGSLAFYASILEILGGDREVLGIDIEIREHNRRALVKHPLFHRIRLLVGSSLDSEIVRCVSEVARKKKKVMVVLDSNHTHTHVLKELQLYSPLVKKGSYLVVFDTLIEHMPEDTYSDRPWGKGNNPKTAVLEFLESNERFEVDRAFENKLMLTTAPSGYLKCIKD
jgi:cephalosporin hydroxylase